MCNIYIKAAIAIAVFITFTFLFKKAAGSLSLMKLNMISVIYYYILVFNLIGGTLIYLGMREHYMVEQIRSELIIDRTYYILAYTVLVFALTLVIMKNICLYRFPKRLEKYTSKSMVWEKNSVIPQIAVFLLALLCLGSIFYVTVRIGYVPVIEAFKGNMDMEELAQAANRGFQGNVYIKNIIMVWLPPYLSYYAFIKLRSTGLKVWKFLFVSLLLMSVFVVTYDLSKAPIINYILGLYLINVTMGNVKNKKSIYKLCILGVSIILLYYVVMLGVGNSIFSIYTGPIGRIIFSQIATLFLHVQLFPVYQPYLQGASFVRWFQFVFPQASGLRSGRVVMSAYNPEGIAANTAGVMNTIFVGEAYANFGRAGVIAAPIIFGMIIGFVAYVLPGLRKTPVSVLLYVEMTLLFITIVEGGFVDIFYSATFILAVGVAVLLKFIESLSCRKTMT